MQVNTVKVPGSDVMATNGVVHFIDSILYPGGKNKILLGGKRVYKTAKRHTLARVGVIVLLKISCNRRACLLCRHPRRESGPDESAAEDDQLLSDQGRTQARPT